LADEAAAAPVPWLCIGVRLPADTLAAEMLAHSLGHLHPVSGGAERVLSAGALDADHLPTLDLDGVRVICLSSFSASPQAQVRHAARRLQRRVPGVQIVAALWQAPPHMATPDAASALGVQAVATTLADALLQLQRLLQATAPQPATKPATVLATDPATNSATSTAPDSHAVLPAWPAAAVGHAP